MSGPGVESASAKSKVRRVAPASQTSGPSVDRQENFPTRLEPPFPKAGGVDETPEAVEAPVTQEVRPRIVHLIGAPTQKEPPQAY